MRRELVRREPSPRVETNEQLSFGTVASGPDGPETIFIFDTDTLAGT